MQPNLQRALSPAPWSRRSPGARNIPPTRRSLAAGKKTQVFSVVVHTILYSMEENIYNVRSWATNNISWWRIKAYFYFNVGAALFAHGWCRLVLRKQEVNRAFAKGELLARDVTSTQEKQNPSNNLFGLEFEETRGDMSFYEPGWTRVHLLKELDFNKQTTAISCTCVCHIQIYRMLNPWAHLFLNSSICSMTCFAGINVPWSEPPHLSVIAIICEVNLWSDAHNFASTIEDWKGEWGKNSSEEAVPEESSPPIPSLHLWLSFEAGLPWITRSWKLVL